MIAPEPTAAHFWLSNAPDSVLDQSYKNPDGTGLAYYKGGRAIVDNQPIAAYQDQEFASEARYVRSHLLSRACPKRYARQSEPGEYPALRPRRTCLRPQRQHRGPGGSSRSFGPSLRRHRLRALLRITSLPYAGSPGHHHRHQNAVSWISKNRDYTSLNFLLANRERLYALRFPANEELYVWRLGTGEDLRGLRSCGTRTETSRRHGAILFASEELDSSPSWEELAPGTLAIARRDLRLELHHL
jgi:predicted glutamine amidotransferase